MRQQKVSRFRHRRVGSGSVSEAVQEGNVSDDTGTDSTHCPNLQCYATTYHNVRWTIDNGLLHFHTEKKGETCAWQRPQTSNSLNNARIKSMDGYRMCSRVGNLTLASMLIQRVRGFLWSFEADSRSSRVLVS